MKKYKIGIDCRLYSGKKTGIGRYLDQLIKYLSQIDSQNTYLLYFNEPDFSDFKPPASNFQKIKVNAPHYSIQEQTSFLWKLLTTKPDLVHFTNFNHPLLYPKFKNQVTTIHDLTPKLYPGKKFNHPIYKFTYNLILKSSLKKAKNIITISENTKKDINKFYPKADQKTSIIYLGVDDLFLNPPKLTKEEQKTINSLPKNYILYTGNWREHKNIITLVKGFHILKQKYNYQGKLVLTGKPDSLYPEASNYIEENNLQDQVHLCGLVPASTLPYINQKADAYIFPSLYEGFGLPTLENFATQTPVISSNAACLPEIGQDACLYFNPNSPEELANQTNKLLQNPDLKKDLIQKGQQRLKDFSFEKMAQRTHKIYIQSLTSK